MPKKRKKQKKSKPSLKPKKKSLSWSESGQEIAKGLIKKTPRSAIVVFSKSGDLIFQVGMKAEQDFTGLGAIISGLQGAKSHLDTLLSVKSLETYCGDAKNFYWIYEMRDWFVLGVRVPQKANLEKLFKHLKKQKPRDERSNVAEALDGLSGAAVDAAFGSSSNSN